MAPVRRGVTAVGLTAVILGAAFLTVGCTPAPVRPDPSPSASVDAGVQLPGEKAGVVGETALPTDIPDSPEARASTQITSCTATDDGWAAEGTVRNPTDADASYVVTVFFTSAAATVVGTGQKSVDVAAGAEATWSVAAEFTAPDETLCALRAVG